MGENPEITSKDYLSLFAELREIMSYDELGLDTLGDERTALFFLISDTDTTYVRPDRAFCIADYWYCSA